MKIGVIGASGKAGSLIVKEAVGRGHEVTAIVRNDYTNKEQGVSILKKDIFDLTVENIKDFDVLINAFGAVPGQEHLHVEAGRALIEILKESPKIKLVVVGGAGSLFVNEEKTVRLMDTKDFPAEYKATAQNQGRNLEDLQNSGNIKWTFISPAIFFNPAGKRTGSYKAGKDNVIVNAKGESYISYADYAIAVLDEIENPKHVNQRFTVVAEAE
jgi:putative NADH-flavin reductase